jgi:hypothetical protein
VKRRPPRPPDMYAVHNGFPLACCTTERAETDPLVPWENTRTAQPRSGHWETRSPLLATSCHWSVALPSYVGMHT